MKAFSGCQGDPEAQQIHSFWKWDALDFLGRIPRVNGGGGTSIT